MVVKVLVVKVMVAKVSEYDHAESYGPDGDVLLPEQRLFDVE